MAKPSTLTFDYGGLDPESRIVIRQKTTEIHRLVKRAAADLVELGQLLLDVKDQLRHGQFGIWLAAEFEWNETTAQRYMRLARVFKSGTVPDLPIKALHLLAMSGTSQEARDEVQHRVDAGEHPSFEDVENIIKDVDAELFEALSPEQQLAVVRREEESALRSAPPQPGRRTHPSVEARAASRGKSPQRGSVVADRGKSYRGIAGPGLGPGGGDAGLIFGETPTAGTRVGCGSARLGLSVRQCPLALERAAASSSAGNGRSWQHARIFELFHDCGQTRLSLDRSQFFVMQSWQPIHVSGGIGQRQPGEAGRHVQGLAIVGMAQPATQRCPPACLVGLLQPARLAPGPWPPRPCGCRWPCVEPVGAASPDIGQRTQENSQLDHARLFQWQLHT